MFYTSGVWCIADVSSVRLSTVFKLRQSQKYACAGSSDVGWVSSVKVLKSRNIVSKR